MIGDQVENEESKDQPPKFGKGKKEEEQDLGWNWSAKAKKDIKEEDKWEPKKAEPADSEFSRAGMKKWFEDKKDEKPKEETTEKKPPTFTSKKAAASNRFI